MESGLSTVQEESEQWTIHSPHLKIKNHPSPHTHKRKREALSLHDTTSHWLQRNFISKIRCHYFWPGLIALPKNTLPIQSFWKIVESPSTSKIKEKLMVSPVFILFTLVWLILNINIYARSNITITIFRIWI
jgi:hypothetical protein